MITSKEVFEKRKAGQIQEAYQMAQELVQNNPHDAWNVKALAYCLIDLIKVASSKNDANSLKNFISQLSSLAIDQQDEILTRSLNSAKALGNPQMKIISDAKALSKQGNHNESVKAYKMALNSFPNDISVHEGLGWELYRIGKDTFGAEKIDVFKAKQLLFEYIKLKNERPSLLHSLFLRYADKLIGSEGFNLVAFLRLWNLNNLTREDYEPYTADNGKIYPSITEKVIQHAAKDALSKKILEDIQYVLPFLDESIDRFPDNFWLTYYKAKLLHSVGQNREAYEFSISVVKAKLNDYWAWDLLAETLVDVDREKAFSCYCKALLCRSEDKFLANVRIKFAELLIQKSLYSEAKYEIDQAIKSRENEGWKLTEILVHYQHSEWHANSTAATDNMALYKQHISLAESLLFDSLPWLNASIGKTFTIARNPDKPKRKIYISIAGKSTPIEIAVSEKRYQFKKMDQGTGLKIKGEYDVENRFQIYLIEPRDAAQKWDVFPESIGIIDHVNHEKKLAHFIVDRKIEGVLHFADYPMMFEVADIVALKLSSHENDKGIQYSVLSCLPTGKEISNSIAKNFKSNVRIVNGLGFTDNDVFIDRFLVEYFEIQDGNNIEGLTVLNFNKKKNTWGWKALTILKVDNKNSI